LEETKKKLVFERVGVLLTDATVSALVNAANALVAGAPRQA
jgi:hypothetical protein